MCIWSQLYGLYDCYDCIPTCARWWQNIVVCIRFLTVVISIHSHGGLTIWWLWPVTRSWFLYNYFLSTILSYEWLLMHEWLISQAEASYAASEGEYRHAAPGSIFGAWASDDVGVLENRGSFTKKLWEHVENYGKFMGKYGNLWNSHGKWWKWWENPGNLWGNYRIQRKMWLNSNGVVNQQSNWFGQPNAINLPWLGMVNIPAINMLMTWEWCKWHCVYHITLLGIILRESKAEPKCKSQMLHGAGIFTNIYIHLPLKSPGHVGEYTIHGVYMGMFWYTKKPTFLPGKLKQQHHCDITVTVMVGIGGQLFPAELLRLVNYCCYPPVNEHNYGKSPLLIINR